MPDENYPQLPDSVRSHAHVTKEDWIKARGLGIGASEVPSLFEKEIVEVGDAAPFQSEFELYARKTGALTKPVEETPTMRMGSRFEAAIVEEYAMLARARVVTPGRTPWTIFSNDNLPGLTATPDRFALDEIRGWHALEAKFTRSHAWDDLPLRVLLQVQAQLAVLGMPVGVVAACFHDDTRAYTVPADAELQGMIIERVRLFWKRVEQKVAPEPRASDLEVVKKLYPRARPEKKVDLLAEHEQVFDKMRSARDFERDWKKLADTHQAVLYEAMKDAEIGVLPSGRRISLKTQKRAAYTVEATEFRVMRELTSKEG